MSGPLLSIDAACARILEVAGGRLGAECVPVCEALDRVLAQDVRASGDAPPFASSAMDGYALGPGTTPASFRVVGESRAGAPYSGPPLSGGEAVRISTGGALPRGAVAVVRQEDTAGAAGELDVRVGVTPGTNMRRAGEDMRAGELVLAAGSRVGAGELAAAIAAGAGELTVARRPVVAAISTGDELRAPGEPLAPGEIHNSNEPMLRALALHAGAALGPRPAGGISTATGAVPDDAAATEASLRETLAACDVLLVSGGVSVGPHDHVRPALARLGVEQHFWGVALQPGKPTWFGSRGRQLVFALPGNPVSAAVTFALFAQPALDALLGARPARQILTAARVTVDVRRNPARDQAIRVTLALDGLELTAAPAGAQESHLITSLTRADALAIIPQGDGWLAAGTTVGLAPLPR